MKQKNGCRQKASFGRREACVQRVPSACHHESKVGGLSGQQQPHALSQAFGIAGLAPTSQSGNILSVGFQWVEPQQRAESPQVLPEGSASRAAGFFNVLPQGTELSLKRSARYIESKAANLA